MYACSDETPWRGARLAASRAAGARMYVYIYIYIERERYRERDIDM